MRSVFFINTQQGWACGADGDILKTTDGGSSWQLLNTWFAQTLNGIRFTDGLKGFVGGTGGKLYRTVDGGTTWTSSTTGLTTSLNSIHFFNAQNGLIAGDNGVILKTTNGTTWQLQTSRTSVNLNAICFHNATYNWAVGESGTILTASSNPGGPIEAGNQITGITFEKTTGGCNPINPTLLPGVVIKALPGPYYSVSDDNGSYKLGLPLLNTATTFTVSALPLSGFGFQSTVVCPSNNQFSVQMDNQADTLTNQDFGLQLLSCHQLDVQIASNRRRRCFRNTTSVSYVNRGSISAPDAYLLVEYPHWVRPLSASRPYIALNDSTWKFTLGTVESGHGEVITVFDSVLCDAPSGLNQCTKATIYPAPDCAPSSSWTGAEVSVSGVCDNGLVHLGIYNIGSGNMADSVDYTVFLDSVNVKAGKVKLVAGDSLKMNVSAYGMTVTLSANQVANHPLEAFVSTSIEACDDTMIYIPRPGVNHFPLAQNAISKMHCLPGRTSYDPNDKQVFPIGFTANKIVKPGTELKYLVRFQNTGNDTAFMVYVVDTLDKNLNPETIDFGLGSHPHKITMQSTSQGKTYIRWQFDNILLPDSNTNELKSHGYLQYRIKPKAGLALGSKVQNEAAIYFDFNLPVLTNRTLTTFNNLTITDTSLNHLVQVVTSIQKVYSSKQLGVTLFPNPVTQNMLTATFTNKGSLILYNSKVQKLIQKENLEGTEVIPFHLEPGFYFARIMTEKGASTEKIVVE